VSVAAEPRTAQSLRSGGRPAADPAERRRALRHLASPVSVLTVSHSDRLHGTTVSTVTTVSLSPLILGVCLKGGSVFAELAAAEGRFSVNVLGGTQGSVARWFADSSRPDGAEQFAGLPWHADPYGRAPLLEGALAHYTCRLVGSTVVGDHEVLLGRVVHAVTGDGDPLLSFAGGLFAGALNPVAPRNDTPTKKENTAP